MAIKKLRMNQKNDAGGFDIFHPETSDDIVLMGDGSKTLDQEVAEIHQSMVETTENIETHKSDTNVHIASEERLSWNAKETPAGAQLKIDHSSYQKVKSNKDIEGIYTTVEMRRKSNGTLAARSVLSGGTSPYYTTRTVTFFAADGVTEEDSDVFTLTYDSDGDLLSEV